MRLAGIPVVLLLLAACETMPGNGTVKDIEGWSFSEHPCVGNRTDALLAEDADHLWVGCGSTAEGFGLFESTDGGLSWSAPKVDPSDALDHFRVSAIQRADDGLLYVAGIDTDTMKRVIALDGQDVIDVYEAGTEVWSSFHVGSFRRTPSGLSVADSLTGVGLVYRTDDEQPWQDGYGWWGSGDSMQILDLVLDGDDLYGCGSTIGAPPRVYVPGSGPGFQMDAIVLGQGVTGELWGLDVHDGAFVAAGVDQERDIGVVFTSGPDPRSADDFTMLDVSELIEGDGTWMRGACRHGDLVWAVGERSRIGEGIVLRSADGGETWEEVTPDDQVEVPALHRCEALQDGTTVIAGADGFVAVAY